MPPFIAQIGTLTWKRELANTAQTRTKYYRLLVIALTLNLHNSHLVLLGSGHQHSGLDQQAVARLHLETFLLHLLSLGLEVDGVPGVLLVAASQGAGPEELLLNIVSSQDSSRF